MTYILYLLSFKSKQVMQKIATNGGDEKRRPPSTENGAVWYTVDIFYWLTSTILQFSICQRRPSCVFIHGWQLPGCWSTVNARWRSTLIDVGRRVDVRRRPFYSPFHHAPRKHEVEWQKRKTPVRCRWLKPNCITLVKFQGATCKGGFILGKIKAIV